MCNKCHGCFLTVAVTTSGGIFKFLENERLRSNPIKAVSVRRANGQTLKTREGATLAVDAVIYTAHLELKDGNGSPIAEMPIQNLWRDTNSPEPLCVDWSRVDPTQSNIYLDLTAAGYNAAHVIEFVFEIACPQCKV